VFAISKAQDADDLQAQLDDHQEVQLVAAAFGEAYLTYDASDVRASDEAILALASDTFAADFADNRAPGIEELFAGLDTQTEATTTEVFVGDVSAGKARALVVVDVVAQSSASDTQTLSDLSFVLDLVEEDGTWKVDAVAPAPQPDVG
jgi:hypothetical protein